MGVLPRVRLTSLLFGFEGRVLNTTVCMHICYNVEQQMISYYGFNRLYSLLLANGRNNDCNAVTEVGKFSSFLARRSDTATGLTLVLALQLVLCSASDALWGGRALGLTGAVGLTIRCTTTWRYRLTIPSKCLNIRNSPHRAGVLQSRKCKRAIKSRQQTGL